MRVLVFLFLSILPSIGYSVDFSALTPAQKRAVKDHFEEIFLEHKALMDELGLPMGTNQGQFISDAVNAHDYSLTAPKTPFYLDALGF